MANPRGSDGVRRADSATPLTLAPKKTSGLVQAAIARRMCEVRNERPTWYAAKSEFRIRV